MVVHNTIDIIWLYFLKIEHLYNHITLLDAYFRALDKTEIGRNLSEVIPNYLCSWTKKSDFKILFTYTLWLHDTKGNRRKSQVISYLIAFLFV